MTSEVGARLRCNPSKEISQGLLRLGALAEIGQSGDTIWGRQRGESYYAETILRSSFIPGPGVSKLTIVQEDVNHVATTYENVMVVFWRGRQEPSVCMGLYELATRLGKIQGKRQVAVVSVGLRGASPPSKATRLALQHLLEDPDRIVYRSAFVPHAGGFVEAGVRSVVLGLRRRLGRHTGHHQVFMRLDDALGWCTDGLVTASGDAVSVAALIDELTSFNLTDSARLGLLG